MPYSCVRVAAVELLATLGKDNGVTTMLLECLDDESDAVRASALQAFSSEDTSGEDLCCIVPHLSRMLQDTAFVRRAAVDVLNKAYAYHADGDLYQADGGLVEESMTSALLPMLQVNCAP